MDIRFPIVSPILSLLLFISASLYSQTLIKCCNCNKTLETRSTGFGEDRSVLRICDECKAKRCIKIADIRAVLQRIIQPATLHSPTVTEWRNMITSNRNTLDIYLSMLERSYCEDPEVIKKIQQLRTDLQALNPGPEYASGQLLRERMKIAEIDLAAAKMDTLGCKKKNTNSLEKITCPPEMKEKSDSDNEALKEYIKEKLKEAGETVVEDTKLGEHLEKLSKTQSYWGYLQQILNATCIPPKLIQAMTNYRTAKTNSEDTADECAVLCRDMTEWFVSISGNSQARQMFMESCLNHCK